MSYKGIKVNEEFSPTVTIVDTATQQPLTVTVYSYCMVRNLQKSAPGHAILCYVAVQVKVVWVSLSEPNTTCVVCGNHVCPPVWLAH